MLYEKKMNFFSLNRVKVSTCKKGRLEINY